MWVYVAFIFIGVTKTHMPERSKVMKKTFTRKGFGRIFVDKPENIETVKQIIHGIDEFEYDYMPDDFIAVFEEYPKLVYTHKFDELDINKLTAMCFKRGIYIFCCDNGFDEFIV